ncbi:hypothetical protein [Bacteroides cellulosilyticus]|uniref:exodeoxyribonuclease X C-terminal domain-containing protein n=1 Tax=Bacteroides cellulosilyticus TaxID=246787 RepID=UPI0032BFABB4
MSEKQDRILSFGKYKGQEIKYIILTHIGYIMWCFENLQWFKLTDEEQELYDAIAISIRKYDCQMTFPVELMYKYIKNREAFERLETPFIDNNGYTAFKKVDKDNPICKSVEKYITSTELHKRLLFPDLCSGLLHSMNKEVDRAYCNGETDEDIFDY